MSKPNIRTINKMIAEKFPGYSLSQEKNYVSIVGPDTHEWYCSGVMVFRVSQMTPEAWLYEVEMGIKNKSTDFTDHS